MQENFKEKSKKVLQKGKIYDIIYGSYRGIAQLVEYRSPKPWVAGSNPPAPAKTEKSIAVGSGLLCFWGF